MKAQHNELTLSAHNNQIPSTSPSRCMGLEENDVALWDVLKPLETTITFLNTGAHPDDERSDLLAYLSKGLGIKTTTLIANRGEGGQNQLGDEAGDALGVLRTREMIEAAKVTGVEAYHLSETTNDAIYDFGIEKTAEETFNKWGEEETHRRLVHFIRATQPDIMMPAFLDIDGEHGHHRAIAILTERAFKDAADPTVFPEQLTEVNTWQVKKLYLPVDSQSANSVAIEIGHYDAVQGLTYPQLGEKSRYFHKTQGMGVALNNEPRQFYLELSQSVVGTKRNLFSGIAYDFHDWAQSLPKQHHLTGRLHALQQSIDDIVLAYPNRSAIYSQLLTTLKDVQQLIKKTSVASLEIGMKFDLLNKLRIKEQQLIDASFIAGDIVIKAQANKTTLTKGQQFDVHVQVTNGGDIDFTTMNANLNVPAGWTARVKSEAISLKSNLSTEIVFNVAVAEGATYFHAYDEAPVQAVVSVGVKDVELEQVVDIDVAVLPEVSLTFIPDHVAVNTADRPDEIALIVQAKNYNENALTADVSLHVPKGWTVSPDVARVNFVEQLQVVDIEFTLSPSQDVKEGRVFIEAFANVNGELLNTSIEEISYDHIGTTYYLQPAELNTIVFELLKPKKLSVGYIESGLDKVADALLNIDFDITKLTAEDLATGDLSVYDTIVVGIRAYLSRKDLVENNARLLQYVEDGGNLVVQYHRPGDGWNGENRAPFNIELGNPSIEWRVTDANAKVTVHKPDSTLFSYPNKITDKDWEGWVQERGLYFPSNWDNQFETVVSMADPNEEAFDGGILIAEHGKGTYIYTNLVFYRQIQNEVAGGYRIFTNLLSYGQGRK